MNVKPNLTLHITTIIIDETNKDITLTIGLKNFETTINNEVNKTKTTTNGPKLIVSQKLKSNQTNNTAPDEITGLEESNEAFHIANLNDISDSNHVITTT
jgi:hypothetical protein